MSVDLPTVRRIAHLARIGLDESEAPALAREVNAILSFVEDLAAVDVTDVEPMTSVIPMRLRTRQDDVTDHAGADAILSNAPVSDGDFFVVPRVVE